MTVGYRARRLDSPVDLVAEAGTHGWVVVRDGVGCAGRGPATVVAADAVLDVLGALEPLDAPSDAPGPVAFGARPFAPEAPWTLSIPSRQVRVGSDGDAWRLDLVEDLGQAVDDDPSPAPAVVATPVGSIAVEAVDDPEAWCAAVAEATRRIATGALDKVVLAREVRARGDRPFDLAALTDRLRTANPGCYAYRVDGLVGASPELLVERHGATVRAQPMAGTTRHDADPDIDAQLTAALFASATYRHEHQVTIDMVHDTLLAFASYIDFQPEPTVVRLPTVSHLASWVEGRLADPPASVLELVAALHPTPAVCGRPRDAAIALIDELEPIRRDRYAGAVGWVDGAGDGTWAVTIRCVQIDPSHPEVARVHAGCGIVADSDPRTELAESEAKLRAALGALED